jgi:hypothetical protein
MPSRRDRLPLPTPAGLRREDAAAFVGLSPGTFDRAVANGELPAGREIAGCRVWSVAGLAAALDARASETETIVVNPCDRLLAQ